METRRLLIDAHLTYFLEEQEDFIKKKINEIRQKLVECLLDNGTIYSIVYSLKDLQMLREKKLFEDRQIAVSKLSNPNDLEKIREIDIEINKQIDEIVKEQQSTLYCSGVPLIKVTDNPNEIKIQMAITKFIFSLSHIFSNVQ